MSLGVTLSTALSGLQVNQRALEITSHNVANANTEGYSRQTAARRTVAYDGQGAGVQSEAVQRTVDQYLQKELRTQNSALGADAVRANYLALTQDLFGAPGSNSSIAASLTGLATGIENLAIQPESQTARIALVEAATAFSRDINILSQRVQNLRAQAEHEITTSVDTINGHLETIAESNRQIARDQVKGLSTAGLEDTRDRALNELAALVDIQYFARADGEIAVYSRNGAPLVDGGANLLSYRPSGGIGVATAFGDITVGGRSLDAANGDGALRGLLDMRDATLPALQTQFDQLAEKVRDQVNAAHNRGTAFPAPAALEGNRTFGDIATGQVTLSGPVRVAVVDAAGTVQAHHDLVAGTYSIAGLRDVLNAGLGGLAAATAADGGTFGIAATTPGHGVAIADMPATGSAVTIGYNDGATIRQYAGFSAFFGLNDFFETGDSVTGGATAGIALSLSVRAAIAADPRAIAAGRLADDPGSPPTAGATVGISAGDSRTLASMAAVFDTAVQFAAAGGLPAVATTLGDYAGEIVSANATKAANAENRNRYQESVVADLGYKAASVSGVNIDEEMANLVTYQNAYAASARLISVVSEMFEILTNLR